LWYRVLKARYGEVGGRIKDGGNDASLWWRMICDVREGVGSGVGIWFEDNIRRVVGNGKNTFFWTDNWLGGVPLKLKFSRLYELSVHKECSVEDMAKLGWEVGGHSWVWRRRLMAWEEESVRECSILLSNVVLQENIQDHWRWVLDPIHGYSVSGTYRYLSSTAEPMATSASNDVWHKLVPVKVSIFVWRLPQDRIPTRANLVRRLVLQPNLNLCAAGCDSVETTDHLFLHCNYFRNVWYHLTGHWLGISFVFPGRIQEFYLQFTQLAGMPRASYHYLKVIWLASVWAIWKARNNCVFKNAVIDPHITLENVKRTSFLWLSSNVHLLAFGFHDWWRHPLLCMGVM